MNACIFAGPTLPTNDPARELSATWLPPARHGDLYRTVRLLRPRAIGLVDGYFQWTPSVRHKEILWAMAQGIHVFGAGSMGALRAAELAPFGMRGVGRIYEAYRTGKLDACPDESFEDDDEVAVVHGPEESGYLAGSEAMVNIRCTLAEARSNRIIGDTTFMQLVEIAKRLYFPERSYSTVLEHGERCGADRLELDTLRRWLPDNRINQKRADALAMIDALRACCDEPVRASHVNYRFEHTTLWERTCAMDPPVPAHGEEDRLVLDEVKLIRDLYSRAHDEALEELIGSSRPLHDSGAGLAGAGASASSQPHLSDLRRAEEEDARRRAAQHVPAWLIERRMLESLRRKGDYPRLLARAQHKQSVLAMSRLPHIDDFPGPRLLQLRDWFFTEVLGYEPDDLDEYLQSSGYGDEAAFHEAVFHEFVYRRTPDTMKAEGLSCLAGAAA